MSSATLVSFDESFKEMKNLVLFKKKNSLIETQINGATNVVDVRIIDLKIRLNEFCTASNNRADASFYGLLKTLNTTNFAFGRLLRDVSNILNATTNHFNKTAVLNETVRSDFLNMMDLTFNQCIGMNTDVIEKYALPTFYAGSYAPNPALLPIKILCDKARKALVSLEKGLIENPKCSTPYLATLVPAMYFIPEKVVAIGNTAIVNIAKEFTETGVAIRVINAYLIALNLQIYHCQISVLPSSNECMAKYVSFQKDYLNFENELLIVLISL